MCTVATTVPKLHWWSPMEPIWHLRWSGSDEVGATGGHVDQQLKDDDGHYVDFQWAEKRKKRQMPILNEFYMVIFTSKFIFGSTVSKSPY